MIAMYNLVVESDRRGIPDPHEAEQTGFEADTHGIRPKSFFPLRNWSNPGPESLWETSSEVIIGVST